MNLKQKIVLGVVGLMICFAPVLFATDATISTTRPQTEDNQMQVDKRNAMSTSGLYEALLGKGTNIVNVSIGGASGSIVTVTNVDITALLTIIQSIYNTNGYIARTNHLNIRSAVVSTNVPTAQTNGAATALWADEYGRTRMKGYDETSDALKVVEQASPITTTYGGDGTWELLSGVSTNYTSDWTDVSRYKNFTFMICPSAATNHQIFIDATLNSGTNWYNVYSATITNTNTIMIQWANYKLQKIRGRILTTNETDTLRGFAGN